MLTAAFIRLVFKILKTNGIKLKSINLDIAENFSGALVFLTYNTHPTKKTFVR
jgi:hypothetical protein